jgi:hypothetical protein
MTRDKKAYRELMATYWSEYRSWLAMRDRCLIKNHTAYPYYGGRGITICDSWLNSFEEFIKDMGPKPTPYYTIDRKNTNGNYEPSNCKWSTRKEQQKNRRSWKKKTN